MPRESPGSRRNDRRRSCRRATLHAPHRNKAKKKLRSDACDDTGLSSLFVASRVSIPLQMLQKGFSRIGVKANNARLSARFSFGKAVVN